MAQNFIDYAKFIWNSFEGGKYAAGDHQLIFHTLGEINYRITGKLVVPVEQNLNQFWLAIVPNGQPIPEKYSYGITDKGKPLYEFPWYHRERVKNWTLLLSSPLPWWAINEVPRQTPLEKMRNQWGKTQWGELEKRWKALEKERGV